MEGSGGIIPRALQSRGREPGSDTGGPEAGHISTKGRLSASYPGAGRGGRGLEAWMTGMMGGADRLGFRDSSHPADLEFTRGVLGVFHLGKCLGVFHLGKCRPWWTQDRGCRLPAPGTHTGILRGHQSRPAEPGRAGGGAPCPPPLIPTRAQAGRGHTRGSRSLCGSSVYFCDSWGQGDIDNPASQGPELARGPAVERA